MKFSLAIAALSFVSAVFAAPAKCVTQQAAEALVTRFSGIITHSGSDLGNAWETGVAILAPEYEEISESVHSNPQIPDQPLGASATLKGRDTILADLLTHPGVGYAETRLVFPIDCNKVLWYWTFHGVGTSGDKVKGFNLLTLNSRNLISRNQFEFNNMTGGTDTYQFRSQQ